ARRVHFPRCGDRGRHADHGGRVARRAARPGGGRSAGDRRAEARVAAISGRVLLALTTVLGGCGRHDRIIVGAKNFTESDLLAEIVAQQIERRVHVPVERRLHLGGTFVCHHAIMAGQIDLYVEYSGTAFTAVLKHPPVADRDSVYRQVANEYSRQFRLRWLAPFGFDNTFAILVREPAQAELPAVYVCDLAIHAVA